MLIVKEDLEHGQPAVFLPKKVYVHQLWQISSKTLKKYAKLLVLNDY